tara:strand:- start:457 stop:1368 length:912 start_codon:yes stop_codon:yes gene_type:complete
MGKNNSADKHYNLIFPSSYPNGKKYIQNIKDLEAKGVFLKENLVSKLSTPRFSFKDRLQSLNQILLKDEESFIFCGRGGYGASDLLPFLDWKKLRQAPTKWLIGFSDICAVQSALLTKLKWPSIHAPMVATDLWEKSNGKDTLELLSLIKKSSKKGSLSVRGLSTSCQGEVSGWLFGGCLSVLCSLIGTPFFPSSLKGAILFFEDTGESPERVLRSWNQIIQNPSFSGVEGIILGAFTNLGSKISPLELKKELSKRSSKPVWSSEDFGHVSPNFPLVIGSSACLGDSQLKWSYDNGFGHNYPW